MLENDGKKNTILFELRTWFLADDRFRSYLRLVQFCLDYEVHFARCGLTAKRRKKLQERCLKKIT